jgi:glycine cleavage system transcriptional repressor
MREVAVTAVGADRPGIVAALTGALLGIGGNLEDVRAALLRGSFATVLAVAVPDEVSSDDVAAALRPVAEELGLGLWVGPATPKAPGPPRPRCVLSVYGADHPGIVHGVTAALAGREVNVIDLSARLVGDPPIYVLGLEVELPAGVTAAGLEADLRGVAGGLEVELTVEPEEDEVL